MKIYLDNCCFNRPFDDQSDMAKSEPFDYTEWQKDLYGDMSLDEFYERVKSARSDTRMA